VASFLILNDEFVGLPVIDWLASQQIRRHADGNTRQVRSVELASQQTQVARTSTDERWKGQSIESDY